MKRLFILLVCIIFIPIGLILLNEFYENEGKYLLKGYKYVNYIRDGNLLQFNEDKIDDFVMIGLNHFLDHRENITKEYLDKCFIGESIIDVQCMYDLKNKNIPILILQGTNDRLVYPTREWMAEMKRLEMNYIYDEIVGADHSFFVSKNKENMKKIFDFFAMHRDQG